VWICAILVVPNLAPVIGRLVALVPTLQKIKAEKEAVDQETFLRMQRVSRTEQASTSIMVLLLVWVLIVLILPNLSPYLAHLGSPTPSMQSIEMEKASMAEEQQRKFQEAWQPWISEARENNTPFPKIVTYFQNLQSDMRRRVAEERGKINEQFRQAMDAQTDLTRLADPALAGSHFHRRGL
jgi:hypothetical protein